MDFDILYLIITIVFITILIFAVIDINKDNKVQVSEIHEMDWDKLETVDDIKILLMAIYPRITFDYDGDRGKSLAKFKKEDQKENR